jgi:hypothetical protein
MGFLDKMKEQAAVATAAAKDAAQKGQAKLDDLQAKRGSDALLRDLGAAVYAQKTDRATPATDSEIERLVGALQEHEASHGALSLGPEAPAAAPAADPGNGVVPPPATGTPLADSPPTGQTL